MSEVLPLINQCNRDGVLKVLEIVLVWVDVPVSRISAFEGGPQPFPFPGIASFPEHPCFKKHEDGIFNRVSGTEKGVEPL